MKPCGTPTCFLLFDEHELIGLTKLVKNSILDNLYNQTGQNVVLKTFLIYKHTTSVDIFFAEL
jgi:hypothetical protein